MSDLALTRSWLLEPDLLRLVQLCRRLIREEFGIKLHLDKPDLQKHLAHFASQTRSIPLVQAWENLNQRLPKDQQVDISEQITRRVYRGQEVYDDSSEKTQNRDISEKLTYRGQKVVKEAPKQNEHRKWERMYRGQYVD